MTRAFFEERADVLTPLAPAGSGWGASHMRGLAISGALARAAECAVGGRGDLVPARWTVDLYKAARMEPSTTRVTVVRESRRLCLVDAVFHQGGEAVSRASGLFVRPGESPSGAVWTRSETIAPPARPSSTTDSERLYHSGDDWSPDAADHLNARRKAIWHFPVPIVTGEAITPFQFAASVADVASLATNFGTVGLEFINPDITVALARLPEGDEVGILATSRIEQSGITIGTSALFDRVGTFGTTVVSGLAQPHRAIRSPVPTQDHQGA